MSTKEDIEVRVFGSIIVFGGTFADIVAAIVTMRAARKKRYRRMRKGILTMFIMSIMVLVVYSVSYTHLTLPTNSRV